MGSIWHRSDSDLERVWLERLPTGLSALATGGTGSASTRSISSIPGDYFPNPFGPCSSWPRTVSIWAGTALQRFVGLVQSTAPLAERILELFDLTSFVSREPLEQTVRETIQFENIRRSQKTLIIAATNWDSGEL